MKETRACLDANWKESQPIVNLERKGTIYKVMLLRDSTIALE